MPLPDEFIFRRHHHRHHRRHHHRHHPLQSGVEHRLIHNLGIEDNITARTLDELPNDAAITHVNAIGRSEAINAVLHAVNDEAHLVAYSGIAWEGRDWRWLDVHHSDASKGGAIKVTSSIRGTEASKALV